MGQERRVWQGEQSAMPKARPRYGRMGAIALAALLVGIVALGALLLSGVIAGGAERPRASEATPAGWITPPPGTSLPGWPLLRADPTLQAPAGAPSTPVGERAPTVEAVRAVGSAATAAPIVSSAGLQPGAEDPRVEEALRRLATDEERVGQLLLLGWLGTTADEAAPTLRQLQPGGIVYVDNARTRAAARAVNDALPRLARESGLLPLLIAVDHEGGEVQRIGDVENLGTNRAFAGRGPTDRQACERGQAHARQLREMGFNMNLAPVLDVNNNPANPVIGSRSYGADPALVARLGSAYVRGLQGGGVVAVGKHFPGHGNTSVDSHLQLPVLPHGEAELERVELVPFRRAIEPDTALAAIMSAHIVFPAVDPSGAPATLSRPIMTGLLRDKLGFQGLVLSDDMAGMRAITDHFAPGQAAVHAVQAGVDLLIIAGGIPRQRASRDALVEALRAGQLDRGQVDDAVRRVLRVKARFGLLGDAPPVAIGCS